MIPKEKAKGLVDKFKEVEGTCYNFRGISQEMAKQCALICVEENKKTLDKFLLDNNIDISVNAMAYIEIKELEEVKQELLKTIEL